MADKDSSKKNNTLTFHQIFAYGMPGIAVTMSMVLLMMYVPKFYADIVGVDLAFISLVILVSRLLDAITDPLIGSLSDKTKSKWGRRRPWIFISSFVLGITLLLIASPPVEFTANQATIYFGVLMILVFTWLTTFIVPYNSLGAELTPSYYERNKLFGFRAVMFNLGVVAVPLTFTILSYYSGSDGVELERQKFFLYGIIVCIVAVFTCSYCVLALKEKVLTEKQKEKTAFFKQFSIIKTNKPFRILIIYSVLSTAILTSIAIQFLFFVQYVIQSDKGDLFLLFYTLSVIIGVPLWLLVSRMLDKHNCLKIAACFSILIGAVMMFLPAGSEIALAITVVLYGAFVVTAMVMLITSMLADTIDYDEWQCGKRRAGAHIGLFQFFAKLAGTVVAASAFGVLAYLGYQANTPQTEIVQYAIRFFYIGVPIIMSILQLIILQFYPLTHEVHEKIRLDLEARENDSE